MRADDEAAPIEEPRRTRWDIRREVGGPGAYASAQGRLFAIGDELTIPPPLPRGARWKVIAVEPPETEGYDGTLVLEHLFDLPDRT
jgi:hypothetical protein